MYMFAAELNHTSILVALITTSGVVAAAYFGYKGITAQLKGSEQRIASKVDGLDSANTQQHGENAQILHKIQRTVESHGLKLDNLGVQVQTMLTAERYMVFRSSTDGSLIEANAAALSMLGVSFEDMMSDPDAIMKKLIHPEDYERVLSHWTTTLATQEPAPRISYRYVHPVTSRVLHVDAAISPLRDYTGNVVEWVSVVVPVKESSHVQAEERAGQVANRH